jgi:uncharacterized LabA/DUF88 family protein
MIRVCIYIDGFNFYHALLRFNDEKVKWLDLAALAERLISPRTEIITGIFYFSAYAEWLSGPKTRHVEYVKALTAVGVIPVMGHFKEKDRSCRRCGATWIAHEEKETDVSIGIALLNDAYKDRYDKALLITRDSDLMPAMKMARAEFPQKEIMVVAPPLMGHSNDLLSVCSSKKKITPKQIWECLLPQQVFGQNGALAATRPRNYD